MRASSPISFFRRTGHAGSDVFQTIVAIVHNRTGRDFTQVFNAVARNNAALLQKPDNLMGGDHFTSLLNRGDAPVTCARTEQAATDIARLAKRFIPHLSFEPTMNQWQALYGAALELERTGVPTSIFNRAPNEQISDADWKRANACSGDVLDHLENEAELQKDCGRRFLDATPDTIMRAFRNLTKSLMSDESLSRDQSFQKIKEEHPIFFTLAMLAFAPEASSR